MQIQQAADGFSAWHGERKDNRVETERLEIRGGRQLDGSIAVSGAKNAVLPIMAACLLTRGRSVLHRVPRLRDVETMIGILRSLGMHVDWLGPHTLSLEPTSNPAPVPQGELVRAMRGSICVLGPLLATHGVAAVPLPGGCVIGARPIDLHLFGLGRLGASITEQDDIVIARAERLRGAEMVLAGPRGSTVTGTANVLMAAALAEGRTVINAAAAEPEIADLCRYLASCGAAIDGIGTNRLVIEGVKELHGAEHTVIPDRIEAGTYLVAAAITGGTVKLTGACEAHMTALLDVLREMGAHLRCQETDISLSMGSDLLAASCETAPHPGVPTDMQPQLTALMCTASGISQVHERVYPDRTTHVPELEHMGARFSVSGSRIQVHGSSLSGAAVHAKDLRAGAALVLAGLAADGLTIVTGLDQLDRGYEGLEERLRKLGADVQRVAAGRLTA